MDQKRQNKRKRYQGSFENLRLRFGSDRSSIVRLNSLRSPVTTFRGVRVDSSVVPNMIHAAFYYAAAFKVSSQRLDFKKSKNRHQTPTEPSVARQFDSERVLSNESRAIDMNVHYGHDYKYRLEVTTTQPSRAPKVHEKKEAETIGPQTSG